jgi:DNA-binding MarR family transcriptional regulator
MTESTRYRLADHVSFTDVDDEAVLLDLNAGSYYGLNHIGARVLTELQTGKTINAVISEIARDFNVESNTVTADIDQLIEQLLSQKLIEYRP